MHSQYNTKGKTTGTSSSSNGSFNGDLSKNESFISLQQTVTSMTNAVSNAANVSNKVKLLQIDVDKLSDSIPTVTTSESSGKDVNQTYSTGYINKKLNSIKIPTITDSIESAIHSDIPTVRAIKSINNIMNIPSVVGTFEESSANTYSTEYINDLAAKIPTPMDSSGVNEDINPMVYTTEYIDNNLPLLFENKDNNEGSNNVYTTHYVNNELKTITTKLDDTIESISAIKHPVNAYTPTDAIAPMVLSNNIMCLNDTQSMKATVDYIYGELFTEKVNAINQVYQNNSIGYTTTVPDYAYRYTLETRESNTPLLVEPRYLLQNIISYAAPLTNVEPLYSNRVKIFGSDDKNVYDGGSSAASAGILFTVLPNYDPKDSESKYFMNKWSNSSVSCGMIDYIISRSGEGLSSRTGARGRFAICHSVGYDSNNNTSDLLNGDWSGLDCLYGDPAVFAINDATTVVNAVFGMDEIDLRSRTINLFGHVSCQHGVHMKSLHPSSYYAMYGANPGAYDTWNDEQLARMSIVIEGSCVFKKRTIPNWGGSYKPGNEKLRVNDIAMHIASEAVDIKYPSATPSVNTDFRVDIEPKIVMHSDSGIAGKLIAPVGDKFRTETSYYSSELLDVNSSLADKIYQSNPLQNVQILLGKDHLEQPMMRPRVDNAISPIGPSLSFPASAQDVIGKYQKYVNSNDTNINNVKDRNDNEQGPDLISLITVLIMDNQLMRRELAIIKNALMNEGVLPRT